MKKQIVPIIIIFCFLFMMPLVALAELVPYYHLDVAGGSPNMNTAGKTSSDGHLIETSFQTDPGYYWFLGNSYASASVDTSGLHAETRSWIEFNSRSWSDDVWAKSSITFANPFMVVPDDPNYPDDPYHKSTVAIEIPYSIEGMIGDQAYLTINQSCAGLDCSVSHYVNATLSLSAPDFSTDPTTVLQTYDIGVYDVEGVLMANVPVNTEITLRADLDLQVRTYSWGTSAVGSYVDFGSTFGYTGSAPEGFKMIWALTPETESSTVPEPATMLLLGLGLVGLAGVRKKIKK